MAPSHPPKSILRPMTPNNHPAHISFGACPKPDRAKTYQLHRTLYDYCAAKSASTGQSAGQSTLNSLVPADKMKSIAEIDWEKGSRRMKAKKGVVGAMEWIEGKCKGKKK